MIITIKFNEKTSDENQMFVLDMNKHNQIFTLEDNINNYTSSYVAPYTTEPKMDLSKYDGFEVYGVFHSYSRIDGFSIFEIETLQIDRDYKLKQLLQ